MSVLYGRTYFAHLTECKESFKWDQREFIYSRTWASFQRQRRKLKADALLTYSSFYSLLLSIILI